MFPKIMNNFQDGVEQIMRSFQLDSDLVKETQVDFNPTTQMMESLWKGYYEEQEEILLAYLAGGVPMNRIKINGPYLTITEEGSYNYHLEGEIKILTEG